MEKRTADEGVDDAVLREALAQWRPPPELAAPAPRADRLSTGGRRSVIVCLVCILPIVGSVGAILGPAYLDDRERDRLLNMEAISTRATVLDYTTGRAKRGPRHFAEYTYIAEGRSYTNQVQVQPRFFQETPAGAQVPLRYAASRPEIHRLDGAILPANGFGLVAGLFPIPLLLLIVLSIRREKRLLAHAQATGAVVTSVQAYKRAWAVRYKFNDEHGRVLIGNGTFRGNRPIVGGTLTLVYDPRHPKRKAALYPLRWTTVEMGPQGFEP